MARRRRSRSTTNWRSFLTNIWRHRVLEAGQPHPSFQLRQVGRENSEVAKAARIDAARMLKRRLKDAGLSDAFSPHSFRTTGITNFWKMTGLLKPPNES